MVVCSGVKSFLNVEKTIEALETFGVTTVGYKTNSFPLFYSSESKNKLQYSFDTVSGLVGAYRENIKNKLQSSLLVLNPVPKKDEIIEEKIKSIVSKSISKMDKLGIVGNKTTPFLLSEIAEKTKNKSLETNISLALNNIKLGATIALKM